MSSFWVQALVVLAIALQIQAAPISSDNSPRLSQRAAALEHYTEEGASGPTSYMIQGLKWDTFGIKTPPKFMKYNPVSAEAVPQGKQSGTWAPLQAKLAFSEDNKIMVADGLWRSSKAARAGEKVKGNAVIQAIPDAKGFLSDLIDKFRTNHHLQLEHLVIPNIEEPDTEKVIKGLETRLYHSGTEGFKAIMGSKLGKMVGKFAGVGPVKSVFVNMENYLIVFNYVDVKEPEPKAASAPAPATAGASTSGTQPLTPEQHKAGCCTVQK